MNSNILFNIYSNRLNLLSGSNENRRYTGTLPINSSSHEKNITKGDLFVLNMGLISKLNLSFFVEYEKCGFENFIAKESVWNSK